MVQFEFAIKKNIIVWVNTVNPEMWQVSVLVGKGRFNENVLGFTDGGAGKFHLHSRWWEVAWGSLWRKLCREERGWGSWENGWGMFPGNTDTDALREWRCDISCVHSLPLSQASGWILFHSSSSLLCSRHCVRHLGILSWITQSSLQELNRVCLGNTSSGIWDAIEMKETLFLEDHRLVS